MRTPSLLAALLLVGCDKRPIRVAPDPAPDARSVESTSLPLVSGCGCAYQCGRGLRVDADGVWEITHDLLDSTSVKAVIERWCFDEKGHAYPEAGAPKEARACRRVFYDRTACGGECIPTTAHLRCGEQ